ncbi:MAG: lytic transglycosylase domain-containing protein [Candidatus Margulisiibacteriota bacterium]|nr:lytic transglycosylase domain-containing protein [Candidatus Margulisiibacteriota bacterium]
MEASTAVIIALFVMTIFSSFGGVTSPSPKNIRPNPNIVRQADRAPIPTSGPINPYYSGVQSATARTAIHKFILKYRRPRQAEEITNSIMVHSQKYNVNPKLVAALIARESRFNPRAVSSAGARGLGQLMPSTAKSLGITNPFNIDQNAKGTIRYVSYLLGRFKKRAKQVSFALAGYLEGPNGVARKNGYSGQSQAYINDIFKYYHKI